MTSPITGETLETGGKGNIGWLSSVRKKIADGFSALMAVLPAARGTGGGLKVDGSGTALPISQVTVLPTADADFTQLITVTTAGSPVQGPDKSNPGGWLFVAHTTNTSWIKWMYHGQTAALKGVPLAPGGSLYVGVSNLSSLDFDAATNGNILTAEKVPQ